MKAAGSRFMDTTLILLVIPSPSSFSLRIPGGIYRVQSMKPVLLALLACCFLLGGCKTVSKLSPFTTDSYCNTVFAYPGNAVAWILDIERPIGPEEFNLEDYD
jgi:hypothetical protein